MPMQPNPRADTSKLLLPNVRFCCPSLSTRRGWARPGRLRRDVPGERVQVEACALEIATEADVAAVHHIGDGGDHLFVRAGILRNRTHEIEERDVACHCRTLRLRAARKFDTRARHEARCRPLLTREPAWWGTVDMSAIMANPRHSRSPPRNC